MNKIEYLLTCLIEECSEIQKEATKALRFGLNDKWRYDTDPSENISMEMGDLLGVFRMLTNEGIVPVLDTEVLINKKIDRIIKWMAYAVERETLVMPKPVDVKDKKIIIINGSGGVGKDTFVDYCAGYASVMNISSVDKVKSAAKILGWNGSKLDKDRKFLSDIKLLSTQYCDHSYNYVKNSINSFIVNPYSELLFLHIREPHEIERIKNDFGALTLLMTNSNVECINTNMADNNVNNYTYDYIINNNLSLDDLKSRANTFISEIQNRK